MWMQTELASTMDWTSALSLCEGAVYAGYSDWRLPNIKELVSKTGSCSQWSSTTRTSNPGQAFAMNSCDEVVSLRNIRLVIYHDERGLDELGASLAEIARHVEVSTSSSAHAVKSLEEKEGE